MDRATAAWDRYVDDQDAAALAAQLAELVNAVREDAQLGRGSMSMIDECYTDDELADLLVELGELDAPADALHALREYLGLVAEHDAELRAGYGPDY